MKKLKFDTYDLDLDPGRRPVVQDIVNILSSLDRLSTFGVGGKMFANIPDLQVKGIGNVGFPISDGMVRKLMKRAVRSRFGKGKDYVLDTAIRDSWEIDASDWVIGGLGWKRTFSSVLGKVAKGLGCPKKRLAASPYKLLIYEPGGMFKPHRDAEKEDGMIGTLTVTLPCSGRGGKLVVRHLGETCTFDLDTEDASEITYAAFFSDCEHEVCPLDSGFRVSLVYNLIQKRASSEGALLAAPDNRQEVRELTRALSLWKEGVVGGEKIIWFLDHRYSSAGLGFDTLKNLDVTVASVLQEGSEMAGCRLYATHVRIWQSGDPYYDGEYDYELEDVISELHDEERSLDVWARPGGGFDDFGEMEMGPSILIPEKVLDQCAPDDCSTEEWMGNAPPSVEHTYNLSALVVWPAGRTLDVVSSSGAEAAVDFVDIKVAEHGIAPGSPARNLVERLVETLPPATRYHRPLGGPYIGRATELVVMLDDPGVTADFVRRIIPEYYAASEEENAALVKALAGFRPVAATRLLTAIMHSKMHSKRSGLVALAVSLFADFRDRGAERWQDALQVVVNTIIDGIDPQRQERSGKQGGSYGRRSDSETVGPETLRDIFILTADLDGEYATRRLAAILTGKTSPVSPDRDLPALLEMLPQNEVYATLWNHAVDTLLERIGSYPEKPGNWQIPYNNPCGCLHCKALKIFCEDPVVRERSFKAAQGVRVHLESRIRKEELDIDLTTIKRGRPYTLHCKKNRNSHRRRVKYYAEDIEVMTRLKDAAGSSASGIARLEAAIRQAR